MSGSPPQQPSLITDPQGISDIEAEWRSLAEARGNAFVTPEWFRAWWEHIGKDDASPLIVVLTQGDALVGVMPLALDASGRPRAIRFAGATLGDRFHPVCAEGDEDRVAAAAMSLLQATELGTRLIRLERVEPERTWLRALSDASPRRMVVVHQQQTNLPYISLEGLDWDTYLSQRSSNLRSTIRRMERVLIRDHGMRIRSSSEKTLESDLDQLFRLHAMRRSQTRDASMLEVPAMQSMLRSFSRSALQQGWLRLHILEVDGGPVAALLGWRLGDSYAYYNSGFDPAWSGRSVGTILLAMAIRAAIEEGAREFDLLLGGENYKRRFTERSRYGETVLLAPLMRPVSLLATGEARARGLGRQLLPLRGVGPLAERLRRGLPGSRA